MSDRAALYRRLPVTAQDRWWRQVAAASPDGRVVELGAGVGRLTLPLAAAGAEVVAVEADPAMVGVLRARRDAAAPQVAARVEIVHARAETVELPPSGAVLAPTSLLNEVDDDARSGLLQAAARCCRPDGVVSCHLLGPWWLASGGRMQTGWLQPEDDAGTVEVTIEFDELDGWPGRRRARLRYRFPDGEVHHDRLDAAVVTAGELRALAAEAGLEVVSAHGAEPGRPPAAADPAWHVQLRPVSGRRASARR